MVSGEDQRSGFMFGDAVIIFDGQEIRPFKDGRPGKPVPVSEFIRWPNAVFRQLMRAVKGTGSA